MNRHIHATLALGLLLGTACSQGTPAEQKVAFSGKITSHFSELNVQASFNRLNYLEDPRAEGASAGLTFSTYWYQEGKFLIVGVKCGGCSLVQDIINYDPDKDSICAACEFKEIFMKGFDLTSAQGAAQDSYTVLPMFTLESESPPLKATVRFIRHQWQFDSKGIIDPGELDAQGTRLADRVTKIDRTPGFGKPGFYRLLATFRGEVTFEFISGEARITDRKPEVPIRHWEARDHFLPPPASGG